MGISRRLYVTALSALAVMLFLLINVRKSTLYILHNVNENVLISNVLSPDQLSYRATSNKNEPAFITSTDSAVAKESHKTRVLMVNDIYVNGHDLPHPELCDLPDLNLRLVIFVTSAPSHSEARDTIRQKWGHYASQVGVVYAFMLGVPDQELFPRIQAEDELHGDIVMGRFVDSYYNLTLKTLSMLEWMDTYCSQALYMLKTDDDMNVHIDQLLKFTELYDVNAARTMWGKLWRRTQSDRITAAKYYMPSQQFAKNIYPDYLSGAAYLMTTDCVPLLLAAAMREPYLRLEDVFITGVSASRVPIRRVHIEEFIGNIAEPMSPDSV